MVPVYYEHENKPAWRRVFTGSMPECQKQIELYPDFMRATYEENKKNRKQKTAEYLLLLSIGKKEKAESIKNQYKL